MTDNFNNALKRAKELLNDGGHSLSIISEVVDDFALTAYKQNELEEEIYLNSESYDVREYDDE